MARQAPETAEQAEAEAACGKRGKTHATRSKKYATLFCFLFFAAFSLFNCVAVCGCVCVWEKVLEEQCLSSSERERETGRQGESESESEQGLPQS